MEIGELVRQTKWEHSIGFIVRFHYDSHGRTVYCVMWFQHEYDTGAITPVYGFEIEVISENR